MLHDNLEQIARRQLDILRDTRDAIANCEALLSEAEMRNDKRKVRTLRRRLKDLRLQELCGRAIFGGKA